MIILKSSIKQIIKKEKAKTAKQVRAEEKELHKKITRTIRADHEKEISKIIMKHKKEILLYKKALKNRDDQHQLDIQAYREYKDHKAFFRNFKEKWAPIIENWMKATGYLTYQLNEGDTRSEISDKRDIKTETKLKVIGGYK